MPHSVYKLAALLCSGLLIVACSDSALQAPAGNRSIAAPIANVTPLAPGSQPPPIPSPPQVQARGYFVIDFISGQVVAASNETQRLEPASLTKLMTAYGVFHALKDGSLKLDDQVHISPHARDQDGSRMFVEVGTQVRVEELIQGMIVQSGNDATVALAERVAGSEPAFVDMMNQYAQRLGMTATHFENSPGMPGPQHYTTAHDIGLLAAALIREYPSYYKWYSQREFTWNKITQPNRNGLLYRDPSVDGLKTGHTESAGYCLVASAKRDDMRLISVVMGSPTVRAREDASAALLNYGFTFFQTRELFTANQPVLTLPLWKGEAEEVKLGVTQDIYAAIPRGQEGTVSATADVPEPLFAPLQQTSAVGKLHLKLGERTLGTYDLHPIEDAAEAGFFGRIIDDVKLWME